LPISTPTGRRSAHVSISRAPAERIICLGEVVSYGADPEWAVDTMMDVVAGAPAQGFGSAAQALMILV
jgi:hypothetical protein